MREAMDVPEDALRALESGEPCRFADLESSCPSTPGVYTLWDGEVLLYAGIARVDPAETKNPQAGGIRGRLRGYPQNRLDSDFAVTIFQDQRAEWRACQLHRHAARLAIARGQIGDLGFDSWC